MKQTTLKIGFLSVIFAFICASAGFGQSNDYAAKSNIIEGIAAFEAGDATADSLFAMGESHSELSALASYNQGRALLENPERAPEARQAFQRAIKGSDDSVMESDSWHNIGNSLLMEEDLENAIEAYKSALRANPRNEAARYNLSYALRQLNQQQEEQNQQDQQDQQGEQDQQDQQNQQDQQDEQEQQGEQDQQDQQSEQDQQEQQEQQEQQQQQEQSQPQQVEGQISKEDMERILESLERGEEEVQAKLMQAKSQGKKKKIEKDW